MKVTLGHPAVVTVTLILRQPRTKTVCWQLPWLQLKQLLLPHSLSQGTSVTYSCQEALHLVLVTFPRPDRRSTTSRKDTEKKSDLLQPLLGTHHQLPGLRKRRGEHLLCRNLGLETLEMTCSCQMTPSDTVARTQLVIRVSGDQFFSRSTVRSSSSYSEKFFIEF